MAQIIFMESDSVIWNSIYRRYGGIKKKNINITLILDNRRLFRSSKMELLNAEKNQIILYLAENKTIFIFWFLGTFWPMFPNVQPLKKYVFQMRKIALINCILLQQK